MKHIEVYEDPISVLDDLKDNGLSGMTKNDLSFLCGVIREFRPKKIVEIGIAAGGTTVVMLNCLRMLDYQCEMYSVDICRQCYLDIKKKSGFVAEKYLEDKKPEKICHKFILGNTIAKCIEEIGNDIDMVILDTMHSLPGELLDFLSVFNSVKEGTVVVFHDIVECQRFPFAFASLVTLSALVGEKIITFDSDRIADFPNIGGVVLAKDYREYLDNLFFALFMNWDYIPQQKQMEEYKRRIIKDFGEKYKKMFERAEELNRFSLYRTNRISLNWYHMKENLLKKKGKKLYLYGHGSIAYMVQEYIEKIFGERIAGYLVSDGQNKDDNTYYLEEFLQMHRTDLKDCLIILALDERWHWDIIYKIKQLGLKDLLFPYNGVGFRDMLDGILFEGKEFLDEVANQNCYEQRITNVYRI